jgi:hypothetical protein
LSISRTWYVSCSPRSPEKIASELRELAKIEGVNWREQNEAGEKIHQIDFAKFLKNLESFEGSISAKDPAFSARDRFAPMQTYGFAFVDSNGNLRITPAGYRLVKGVRVQELFLKQMLKWQYPSWQHGGNTRTRSHYPLTDQMDIFPCVATLQACRKLGGLSKEEIAMFLLPVLIQKEVSCIIQAIKSFRIECSTRHGRHRIEFINREHKRHFRNIYAHEISHGMIGTRESRTSTVDDFLNKKMRNSLDVADAAIRYFRATGLFTLSADFHGLTISPVHSREVDRILKEMEFKTVEFYDDVDRFYEYMGNPDLPILPWETKDQLEARAVSLGVRQKVARNLSPTKLKETIEKQEQEQKVKRLLKYTAYLQNDEAVANILTIFNHIQQRNVVDPALFLEWNVWRALASIDDCKEARPNFTIDDDLQPYSPAPGKKADMEIEYNDSFIALIEVTLSTGARQYDTEAEPVTRHVGRFQFEENSKQKPRVVYGLFIAPKINPSVLRHK